MTLRISKIILFLFILLQTYLPAQKKEIVAYYPRGSVSHGSYCVKSMEESGSASKITVLNYSFAIPGPDSSGNIVPKLMNTYFDYQQPYTSEMSIDGISDDSMQALKGQFNQLKKLKWMYPELKILLSIGGWGGSVYFSDAALTAQSREKFVNECINEFILGNLPLEGGAGGTGSASGIFDGFDLDWEFPVEGGADGTHHNQNDMNNFTELVKLFRQKLNEINPELLLTAAVSARLPELPIYNFKEDQKYFNWFNVMTYDYHGIWDNITYHHTSLFSPRGDTTNGGQGASLNNTVRFMIDSLKIPPAKIIPGAAFYGKGWGQVDSLNHGLFQPGDPYNKSLQIPHSYKDLIKLEENGYQYYWDNEAMAPWLYNSAEKVFWTFDDAKSVSLKTRYADAYNLGGMMFWAINGDDSVGTLVNTIYTRNMPDIKIAEPEPGKSFPSIKVSILEGSKTIPAGSDLFIDTEYSDKGGKVIKVEFFGDKVSLGYVTKEPFNWVWFDIPKGKHFIEAVATDNKGNKKTSKAVMIDVKN